MPPVSEPARQALDGAHEEARSLRHSYVGTEHILLALLREPDGSPRRLLEYRGATHHAVRAKVVRMMGIGVESDLDELPLTARGRHAVELAQDEARSLGHEQVGTEHILLALLGVPADAAARILLDLDVDPGEIRHEIVRSLSSRAG